jgi:16S rRNA (cytidine1402-2'-O)-methyltransferase
MSGQQNGRLYLVPNTLDLGTWAVDAAPPDLHEVLPVGVMRVAARLSYWVAENAKSARALLKRVGAEVPLAQPLQALSIQELPRPPKGGKPAGVADERARMLQLLAPAMAGHDIGLVSEAGLPGVADPGAALVREAHAQGLVVVPMSGPSSLVLAVAASGLNGQSFAFVGYLPTDAGQRAQRLRELEAHSQRWQQTQLLIETPYRNAAMLRALQQDLRPGTWLSVSCGLTLAGGWTRTMTVAQWRQADVSVPADVPAVFAFLA